jgi:hypothetical protein
MAETQETLAETPGETGRPIPAGEFQRRVLKRLDHLDDQLHEIRQFIEENRGALERATRLLHNPVSEYLKRTKGR